MEMEKAKWSKTCLKLSASDNNSRCLKQQQKNQLTDIVYSNTEWPWDVLNVILKHFQLIPNSSLRCICTRTGFLILKTVLFHSITFYSFEQCECQDIVKATWSYQYDVSVSSLIVLSNFLYFLLFQAF